MEQETKQDIIGLGLALLGVIVLSIYMFSSVSALYAGESMTFDTNLTNPVFVVTGNSSNLDGLDISFENGNITLVSDMLMKSDNFTLVFFDQVTHETEKIVYRGGGGSSSTTTKYVDKIVNQTVYLPEYVDRIVNNTITLQSNDTVDTDELVDEIENKNFWLYFMGVLLIVLIVYILSQIYFSRYDEPYDIEIADEVENVEGEQYERDNNSTTTD